MKPAIKQLETRVVIASFVGFLCRPCKSVVPCLSPAWSFDIVTVVPSSYCPNDALEVMVTRCWVTVFGFNVDVCLLLVVGGGFVVWLGTTVDSTVDSGVEDWEKFSVVSFMAAAVDGEGAVVWPQKVVSPEHLAAQSDNRIKWMCFNHSTPPVKTLEQLNILTYI